MSENHFLQQIFKVDRFKQSELHAIVSEFKQLTFKKNEFLLSEGKTANHYWYIETGFIRAFVYNNEGSDITTNFYSKGDVVIDWSSFFTRMPTRENIQALTDVICWQLDFETFQLLFNQIESFREHGRSNLVASYFVLKERNIAFIVDPAKDRYKRLLKDKPQLIQNVSLKQIASYLGITDTSLSRIRAKIAKE